MSSVKKRSRRDESDGSQVASGPLSGVIRFEVDTISTLDSYGRDSPEVEVGGAHWKAWVQKEKVAGVEHLAVYLSCMRNRSRLWNIEAEHVHILEHPDGNRTFRQLMGTSSFNHDTYSWGQELIKWSDLVNKEFVIDDKITVELHFSILKSRGIMTDPHVDFTDPKDPRHDIAFVIDGEMIYANKAILSVHSSVFNAMFYGEFIEQDKKEIELKDVKREEFVEMLSEIYRPSTHKISDYNVTVLLELGDRYQCKLVLDLAENYLISSTLPELAAKLLISEQYRLIKLQDHCLSRLRAKDVKKLMNTPEYNGLSDATKVALLEKVAKLCSC